LEGAGATNSFGADEEVDLLKVKLSLTADEFSSFVVVVQVLRLVSASF
jgi:hypothetical protein